MNKKVVIGILVVLVIFSGIFFWANNGRLPNQVQTLENGLNYKVGESNYDFTKEPLTAKKFDYLTIFTE